MELFNSYMDWEMREVNTRVIGRGGVNKEVDYLLYAINPRFTEAKPFDQLLH